VKDAISASNYADDLDNQVDDNYGYDAIGNLIKDTKAGISNISWTVYGKIKSITKTNGQNISYAYDPSGNRVVKTANGLSTFYVRDAQGNSVAVYNTAGNTSNWMEQHLYGSSRLGMWKPGIVLANGNATTAWDTIGKKSYELINHLGNVMAVISDIRSLLNSTYDADVVNAQDYTPFGSLMAGRRWSLGETYNFGFNG
jgi:YD repeat-containing protein